MKSGINQRVGFALAVGLSLTGLLVIKPVLAQVASSTPDATTTTSNIYSTGSSTSTTDVTSASSTTSFFSGLADTVASSSATSTEPSEPAPVTPSEPAPQGLSLVHIIGTKYTDYFTDGTTETSYPGDPTIDANLGKRDAPIPTHEGLTWVHTTGQNLYDTPSGDLEVGDYALQTNGDYVENAPPFVSSTSTPESMQTQTTRTQTPTRTASSTASSSQDTATTSIDTSINPGQGSSTSSDNGTTAIPAGTSTDSL
jgi:hypothetical protein